MRAYLFLLCTVALGFSTEITLAQEEVRIDRDKTVPIDEVFNIIIQQTKYYFIYPENLFENVPKVQLHKGIITVTQLLKKSLLPERFNFNFTKSNAITIEENKTSPNEDTVQDIIVKGTVTDKNNIPIAGVTVLIKGTQKGSVTNFDGVYEIKAGKNDTLVFSYIGYNTVEVLVNDQSTINIQLSESINALSEVIITGTATSTDKRKIPFAVDKINEKDIERVPGINIASALQGKVAGATIIQANGAPGQAPSIRLRGSTNIVGSQAPLIIIDGVITDGDGDLQDFNSDDIESIEIVKGAAAASLYGSRSANGVINIRTKRGGDINGKTTTIIRNELGITTRPRFLPLSTHHPFKLNADGSLDSSNTDLDQFADNNYPTLFNHQNRLFKNAIFYTNFVSFGSSTKKTKLYWSLNNTRQNGTLVDTDGYGRQNIRLNIDHVLADGLSFKASSSYSQSKSDGQLTGIGSVFMNSLTIPPHLNLEDPNPEDGSPFDHDIANVFIPGSTNPLYELNNISNTSKRNRFTGAYSLKYNPINPLSFEVAYTIDKSEENRETLIPKNYLNILDNPNKGRLTKNAFNSKYETASFKTTFSKKFENFDVTSQLYYLYENVENNFLNVNGYNFRFNDVVSLGNSVLDPNLTRADSSLENTVSENFYFISNVVYKDRLILDGMIRRDGSSLFGANNRWNTFYRGSIAYRLSEDLKIKGINEFKLRASYGTAGNRPGYNYRFETYTLQGTKATIGNKNLRSSLSKELEVGMDITFLDKYNFSATYATSASTKLFWLLNQSVAAGGFPKQWVNLDASLDANTYEATLQGPIFQSGNLEITGGLIFSKVIQRLSKFNHVPDFSNDLYLEEGVDFGVMRAEKFATSIDQLSNSQKQTGSYVINSDGFVVNSSDIGTVNEAPVKILDETGNPALFNVANFNPDFNLGMNLNTKFKGFSLYILADWKQGGDIYNGGKQLLYSTGRDIDIDQANVPQNLKKPITYYTAIANNNSRVDYFVEDGTYVKIREISFGYEFSQKQLGALAKSIKNIKLSLVGRNLFTFSNYSGYNPEVNSGAIQNGAFGQQNADLTNGIVDYYSYPNSSVITGKLEIKF